MSAAWKLYNVFILSSAFLFIFTAFQTSGNIETTTVGVFFSNSCNSTDYVSYGDDLGFYSLCVTYVCMGIATLLGPPMIGMIGAKATIVISAVFYVALVPILIRPLVGTLFVGSVLAGIGGGIVWTAQGDIIFSNSDSKTLGRNMGIFWMFLQSSFIIGNLFYFLFVYLQQQDSPGYNDDTICISGTVNAIIYGVLGVLGLVGVAFLLFLRTGVSSVPEKGKLLLDKSINSGKRVSKHNAINSDSDSEADSEVVAIKPTFWSAKLAILKKSGRDFLRTFQLMCSVRMGLLMVTFTYLGFELTFLAGVIGTLAARTIQRAEYAGVVGMAVGVGEVVGGFLVTVLSPVIRRIGRKPVVLFGYVCHMVSFLLVFYTVPDDANAHLHPTAQPYLITGKFAATLALIATGFLLGLGDCCFNTQMYSIIGEGYPGTDGAPAISIFQCMQSTAAGVAFLYNGLGQIALKWEMLILVLSGTAGTLSFMLADWNLKKKGPTQKQE